MISANSLLELDAPPAPLRATPVTAPGVNAVYDAPAPRISGSQLIAARGRSSRCTAYPFAFAAAPSSSQAFSDPRRQKRIPDHYDHPPRVLVRAPVHLLHRRL